MKAQGRSSGAEISRLSRLCAGYISIEELAGRIIGPDLDFDEIMPINGFLAHPEVVEHLKVRLHLSEST